MRDRETLFQLDEHHHHTLEYTISTVVDDENGGTTSSHLFIFTMIFLLCGAECYLRVSLLIYYDVYIGRCMPLHDCCAFEQNWHNPPKLSASWKCINFHIYCFENLSGLVQRTRETTTTH